MSKKMVSQVLNNKMLLKVVVVLAALNVMFHLREGDINSVLLFGIVGILVSYFSKNQLVMVLTPLLLVNLFNYVQNQQLFRYEGLSEEYDDDDDEERGDVENMDNMTPLEGPPGADADVMNKFGYELEDVVEENVDDDESEDDEE